MTALLAAVLLSFAQSSARADAFSMDRMLDRRGSTWKLSPDAFMEQYSRTLGFSWVSTTMKHSARTRGQQLNVLGMRVDEALVSFEDEKAKEITFILYNRGDTGEISKESFDKFVEVAQQKISKWTKARPKAVDSPYSAGGVKRKGCVWSVSPNQFKLEWSYSSGSRSTKGYIFRSEYIRLKCQQMNSGNDYRSSLAAKKSVSGTVSRRELKSHIVKTSNGDVYVNDIPMVDQGQKGYCVVATTERIMRYFGRDVDQHEMAQLAQTGTGGGTNPASMVNAIRKLGTSLGCKVSTHQDFALKDFVRLIRAYNRAAKKGDRAEIQYGQVISVGEIYSAMDAEILRTVRLKSKADMKRFKDVIAEYVDNGMPLPWSVRLGLVPEKQLSPQTSGGHMRMIIGYNTKTQELLFSDSWGRGHELKRMTMINAWVITTGLYTIEPSRLSF